MPTPIPDYQFVLMAAALASPRRLRMLDLLRNLDKLPASNSEISEHGLNQRGMIRLCPDINATASVRHLNTLTAAGLLIRTSAFHLGYRRTFYRRNDEAIIAFAYTTARRLCQAG
ncbi:hypothetical protein [Amycolatopsis sp. lyj-84]|uniref:hypothetical protein n=1 Tax=Amycolatopsis sp. lyj-84 TaxID=2789284 RepID=UPI00397E1B97